MEKVWCAVPEWQKMVAGSPADAGDPELKAAQSESAARKALSHLQHQLAGENRRGMLWLTRELLWRARQRVRQSTRRPLRTMAPTSSSCESLYANANRTIPDVSARRHIGDNVLTLALWGRSHTCRLHPLPPARAANVSWVESPASRCGSAITIVWTGGMYVICPWRYHYR